MNSVSKLRLSNIPEGTTLALTGVEDYSGDRAPTWQRYSLNSTDWASATNGAGGAAVNGVTFGSINLWSGTSTNGYAAVQLPHFMMDAWTTADLTQNAADIIDWSVPFEAECQFTLVSGHATANTTFRWLIGRATGDISTPNISSWFNGIGLTVENQELYLVTAILGTTHHLDTGYSVPTGVLSRVKLRSLGNGVVRVYVEGAGPVDNLVYSCTASQGPTGSTGPAYVEFHTTTAGTDVAYVIVSGMRFKR